MSRAAHCPRAMAVGQQGPATCPAQASSLQTQTHAPAPCWSPWGHPSPGVLGQCEFSRTGHPALTHTPHPLLGERCQDPCRHPNLCRTIHTIPSPLPGPVLSIFQTPMSPPTSHLPPYTPHTHTCTHMHTRMYTCTHIHNDAGLSKGTGANLKELPGAKVGKSEQQN